MAVKFCLPFQQVQEFKKALKDKMVTIPELFNMDTQERTELFKKYVGDNAKDVNTLFEEKLILKNQVKGIENWIAKITQSKRYSPEKIAELKQQLEDYKVQQKERIFNPKENQTFLNDLADRAIGTHITREEAVTISNFSQKLEDLKQSYDETKQQWTSEKDAVEYGAQRVAYLKYIDALKNPDSSIGKMLLSRLEQFKNESEANRVRATGNLFADMVKTIARTSTEMVATLDDSLFGRQGIFNLLTWHGNIWLRNFAKSFFDITKTLTGQEVIDGLKAKLYSDPLYLNGEYQKAGILGINEEQFPVGLGEKMSKIGSTSNIPIRIASLPLRMVGTLSKASEVAFEAGGLRMRTELYKLERKTFLDHGMNPTDAEIKGMGDLVNSIGAKGNIGKLSNNPILTALMWAPRMLKADLDILTAHSFSDMPTSVRRKAQMNFIKLLLTVTVVTSVADAVKPNSVELDPRSSQFLQVDRKYSYLRGIPQIITLFARLISGSYKNSNGIIVPYSSGFGSKSRLDAVYSFLRGKAPPATGAGYDILSGKDYNGNPPTLSSILFQRGIAISVQNAKILKENPTIDNTLGAALDFIGFNANLNSSNKDINWNNNPTKQLIDFKKQVGNTNFINANNEFNNEYNKWLSKTIISETYKKLPDIVKQEVIIKAKKQIQQKIFDKYNFTPSTDRNGQSPQSDSVDSLLP